MERDHEPENSSNDLANQGQPADPGAWDPSERVGDVYDVEICPTGQMEHAERLRDDRPKIWVGSLSDYNNGILHGEWIDAAREPDEIWADVHRMLANSPTTARYGDPAEEWGIFDYDGFGNATVHQHDNIDIVARVARGIVEHGLAFAAWADVMEGNEDALDGFTEAYLGHFDSVEDYARQVMDDLGYEQQLDEAIPQQLRPYVEIAYERLALDWSIGGDINVIQADGGGVWIFNDQ